MTTVEVTVQFADHEEMFLVFVRPHSDWRVTNVDAMHIVMRNLRCEFQSIIARTYAQETA